ncbi:uncharacterized mitochondrial protein AtMg00860-like [Capsicum annuum]|uniref:uncharacterized mitochondrial protein AtMg00860-like n=1 Tax=Capsicum annuum TaxID=4072 RepID=UPI001FB150A3|nr:uncharacterized mitochondrial protein AtMg00860-like [Capsicum annuum]
MDPKKVQAIVKWQAPSEVKELRSFLGLANYYRKFIAGYSKKATSLIDFLKKDVKWVWSDKCDAAFQTLKEAISSKPILKLSNFELPFEVHIDALDKAMGAWLFYMNVVKHFSLLSDIVSDKDAWFTERISHLRHYMTARQWNWEDLLDTAQFCYNLHRSAATEKSLFELVLGM